MENKQPEKAFFLNLKKYVSKNGKAYYRGKFAYAIDLIAFEKKDGSGDLTVWLEPKNMDELSAKNKGYAQQQAKPAPPQLQGASYSRPPERHVPPVAPSNDIPWPEDNF